MSKFLVALFFTLGVSTWIYTKLQKYSGNNTRQSAISAAVIGLVIFMVIYLVQGMFY